MLIIGIKLTHDGAIALIEDGRLIFSYEMEKLNNFHRHSPFCITITELGSILARYGYSLDTIDRIVIDGWSSWDADKIHQPEQEEIEVVKFEFGNSEVRITTRELAGYGHLVKSTDNILVPRNFEFSQQGFSYTSFQHVAGHVAAAYCTSPFSARNENSYILVWDGGMPPQLFYYRFERNSIENLGLLFPLIGYLYINFAHAFKPFSLMPLEMSIAGKAMAYMALGSVNARILQGYRSIFSDLKSTADDVEMSIDIIAVITRQFIIEARELFVTGNFAEEDMLTTFQEFVQELLIDALGDELVKYPGFVNNLCISGGCGLNIKWNSGIRNSRLFKEVWVPPFPNDSGSAIGTACCQMLLSGRRSLEWNVYSGPPVRTFDGQLLHVSVESDGYSVFHCELEDLAYILHTYNEPVVFFNDRAELGPRALGNRSILAQATSPNMKKRLNAMKGREGYRPVAPLCLEERAAEIFSPGSPDPYMLFEHFVNDTWKDRVPAICHLDGSARLQTVNSKGNAVIYRLLTEYYKRSQIPLLCNTSANLNGSGFFPDIQSALDWNKANLVWYNNILFVRTKFMHLKIGGELQNRLVSSVL